MACGPLCVSMKSSHHRRTGGETSRFCLLLLEHVASQQKLAFLDALSAEEGIEQRDAANGAHKRRHESGDGAHDFIQEERLRQRQQAEQHNQCEVVRASNGCNLAHHHHHHFQRSVGDVVACVARNGLALVNFCMVHILRSNLHLLRGLQTSSNSGHFKIYMYVVGLVTIVERWAAGPVNSTMHDRTNSAGPETGLTARRCAQSTKIRISEQRTSSHLPTRVTAAGGSQLLLMAWTMPGPRTRGVVASHLIESDERNLFFSWIAYKSLKSSYILPAPELRTRQAVQRCH